MEDTVVALDDASSIVQDLQKDLKFKSGDTEVMQATKLKYQASMESQFVQGCLNNVSVYQGGVRALLAAT